MLKFRRKWNEGPGFDPKNLSNDKDILLDGTRTYTEYMAKIVVYFYFNSKDSGQLMSLWPMHRGVPKSSYIKK